MTDAWRQLHDLYEKYTVAWQPRKDLRVTALGAERTVRFELGYDYKADRPGGPYRWHATTRNVSTMRELAQAILDACDFVERANPVWADKAPNDD